MRRRITGSVAIGVAMVLVGAGQAAAQSVDTGSVSSFWNGARGVMTVDNPADDRTFYRAPEGTDLAALAPGTVLRERTLTYHVATIDTPIRVTQLLYTTVDAVGAPMANVTSVLEPPVPANDDVVAYQSFYDSLDPADAPSRFIAGNMTVGGIISTVEAALVAPALLGGHRVVIADIEGPTAQFAAGPAYGHATLDSLRAVTNSRTAGVGEHSRFGLFGYSGGAIASNWAAILLADYAPELAPRVVGVAEGGVFATPIHNLGYAGQGPLWSPVVAMAMAGVGRSYHVDLDKYLNDRGRRIRADVENLSIVEAYGRYPNIRWEDIALPQYPKVEDAPEVKAILDSLNMGTAPIPAMPIMIHQGAAGQIEGTPPQIPGVGHGDGVMVTGDVRSLARRYCEAGTAVEYREYPWLSHGTTVLPWAAEGLRWLDDRFRGVPAPNNCATIPPGNDISGR